MSDTAKPQNEHIEPPGPTTGDQACNLDSFPAEIELRLENTRTLLGADLRSTASADLATARWIASSTLPWNA